MIPVVVLLSLLSPSVAGRLRHSRGYAAMNRTAAAKSTSAADLLEVTVGGFPDTAEACGECAMSFTKLGSAPAGPIAPLCICMSYAEGGDHKFFCATSPSAVGYIAGKEGCRCKIRDMEHLAANTCEPIPEVP